MSNKLIEQNIDFLENDFELVGEDNLTHVDKNYASQPYWKDVLNRFKKNKGAMIGLVCIILITFIAIIGVGLNGHTYDSQIITQQNLAPRIPGLEKLGIFNGSESMNTSTGTVKVNKYVTQGKETGLEKVYYWFGTDVLGRDIFTRTWMGTRISLYIAFVAVLIDMLFGLSYGLISGYFGGAVDTAMQRFVEILNGIPNLVIVTLLIIVLKPGLVTITLSLMITGWIGLKKDRGQH
jgi:oligopeptide transport system permease protein